MRGDAIELVVRSRTGLARSVVEFELAAPDGSRLPEGTPGAHIDLVLPSGRIRQYSLYPGADPGAWYIAVLRETGGRGGSSELHDEVVPGTRLRALGPRNRFPLHPADDLLFIAGGIGITPLLPMIGEAERRGTRWRLAYGGRSRASMAFLPQLARYGARVTTVPQDEDGPLDLDALFGALPAGALVYCCGPEGLLEAVRQRCRELPPGTLHTERFSAAPEAGPGPDEEAADAAFDVVLARSGRTVRVPAGAPVLQAVREAGVQVLVSCEQGTCGTCETGVLQGVPEHRDSLLTEEERAAGDLMLICVSRSLTPRLVLDL
ncbi:PDR/VanB family oxidoreductase [Streptomyces sp. NPDC052396]|uniref:PDR/VanB family oxidoreductase n=1 Tax=Streptomyces sp. NPDC052396 TaxID=3365689 RepID=UPI0037D8B2FF